MKNLRSLLAGLTTFTLLMMTSTFVFAQGGDDAIYTFNHFGSHGLTHRQAEIEAGFKFSFGGKARNRDPGHLFINFNGNNPSANVGLGYIHSLSRESGYSGFTARLINSDSSRQLNIPLNTVWHSLSEEKGSGLFSNPVMALGAAGALLALAYATDDDDDDEPCEPARINGSPIVVAGIVVCYRPDSD
jgi:hypothetical protein